MYCYRSKIWGSQNAKYGPFRLLVGIGLSQPKGGAPFELGTGSLLGFLLRLSQLTLGPPLSCDCLSSPHIYFILYCSLSLWCSLLFPRGLDFTLSWAFTQPMIWLLFYCSLGLWCSLLFLSGFDLQFLWLLSSQYLILHSLWLAFKSFESVHQMPYIFHVYCSLGLWCSLPLFTKA